MMELVFVLDESGSMDTLAEDTIGGFNSMIAQQREEGADALVSTVLFSTDMKIIHDRVPLGDVPKLTRREYRPGGCTALLDAVGGTIQHISRVHRHAREDDRPDGTLVVITTDGLENASSRYSYEDVRRLISERKERQGWEFLFLGANIDAAREAGRMGIEPTRAATFAAEPMAVRRNFEAMGCAISGLSELGAVPDAWSGCVIAPDDHE